MTRGKTMSFFISRKSVIVETRTTKETDLTRKESRSTPTVKKQQQQVRL